MVAEVLTGRFPPAAAARICAQLLNRHSPHEIACAIEVLIDLRDIMDGDPDAETEGLEDDFTPVLSGVDYGPGCALSDPGGQCTEDEISSYQPGDFASLGPGCPISDPGERDEVGQ